MKRPVLLFALCATLSPLARAEEPPASAPADLPPAVLSRFGEGTGPVERDGTFHLLDEARTPRAVERRRLRPGGGGGVRDLATRREAAGPRGRRRGGVPVPRHRGVRGARPRAVPRELDRAEPRGVRSRWGSTSTTPRAGRCSPPSATTRTCRNGRSRSTSTGGRS